MFSRKRHHCWRWLTFWAIKICSKPCCNKVSGSLSLACVCSHSHRICHFALVGGFMCKSCAEIINAVCEINSKLLSVPKLYFCNIFNKLIHSSIETQSAHSVVISCGGGNNFSVAAVITPSVPSLPINKCFKSKPAVFLCKGDSCEISSPFGKTTSKPNTKSRIVPYRNTLIPPAFAAILPPI